MRVLDHNVRAAVRIPPIGVLRRAARHTASRNGNIAKHDVCRICNQVVPLRRISEVQIGDATAVQADSAKKDGAQDVDVFGIEIIPHLAVAVERASAKYIDICAAELEEGGCVLEDLLEGVGLPVVGVVCELDGALDVYKTM